METQSEVKTQLSVGFAFLTALLYWSLILLAYFCNYAGIPWKNSNCREQGPVARVLTAQNWKEPKIGATVSIVRRANNQKHCGGFFWSLKAHIFCCFKCYRRNSCGEMLPILVVSFLWNYSGQHGWVDQGSVTQRSLFKSNAVKRLLRHPAD